MGFVLVLGLADGLASAPASDSFVVHLHDIFRCEVGVIVWAAVYTTLRIQTDEYSYMSTIWLSLEQSFDLARDLSSCRPLTIFFLT